MATACSPEAFIGISIQCRRDLSMILPGWSVEFCQSDKAAAIHFKLKTQATRCELLRDPHFGNAESPSPIHALIQVFDDTSVCCEQCSSESELSQLGLPP